MTSAHTPSTQTHNQWQALCAQTSHIRLFANGESFAPSIAAQAHFLLTDAGIVEVAGSDATTFLQGQLTADCSEQQPNTTAWAAHCNPQGRVNASFFLHKIDEQRYLLYLPASNVDNAVAALNKYAVFSKVAISDLSHTFCAVGHRPGESIEGAICLQLDNNLSISLRRWEKSDGIGKTLQTLPQDTIGGSINWKAALIAAGYAMVESPSSGEHVAQMLNMDLLDGISFSKGCYTGQEVIARLKYKGEAKRRCYRLSIDCGDSVADAENLPLKPGHAISQPGSDEGQRPVTLGEVITASIEGNRIHALAVLKNSALPKPGRSAVTLTFSSADNPQDSKNLATVIDQSLPPYAIN